MKDKQKTNQALRALVILGVATILCISLVSAFIFRTEFYDGSADASSQSTGVNLRLQTITIGTVGINTAYNITQLEMYAVTGASGSNITIIEWDNINNQTVGSGIALNTSLDTSTWSGSPEWHNITITPTSPVTPGTSYAIIYYGFEAYLDNTSPSYAGGSRYASSDGGATWTASLTQDYLFYLYGNLTTLSSVSLDYPSNNTAFVGAQVFNASYIFEPELVNATYYFWNSTNAIVNKTTQSLTGNINSSSFNLASLPALGQYSWNVLGCSASSCSWANFNYSLNYGYSLNSVEYNTTTTETAQEGYILNFTYDNANYVFSNGYLIYDGAQYVATKAGSGNNIVLSNTLSLPQGIGTKNFFWRLVFNNGNEINTTSYNQAIGELGAIQVALSCNDKAIAFTLKDEQNQTDLNGTFLYNIQYGLADATSKTINGSLANTNSFYLCINSTISPTWKLGYGEIQYSSEGYVDRRYYLFANQTISNNTLANHTLYDLLSSEQTSFIVYGEDTDLTPYTDNYIALLRWYPEFNDYRIVDMGHTDEYGATVSHVQTEDVDYRVGLYYLNGTLIKLGDPVRFICQAVPCSFTLKVDSSPIDFTTFFNIQSSLTYNETTQIITYIYNDPSQSTSAMRLLVTKETGTGSITLCDTSSSGYTGVITCDVSSYSGNFKAVVYRSASPEVPIAQALFTTISTVFKSQYGLFISGILWLAIVLTGFSSALISPVVIIILGIVGLIPALAVGSINLTIFTGIIVLGSIIIHFIKRTQS